MFLCNTCAHAKYELAPETLMRAQTLNQCGVCSQTTHVVDVPNDLLIPKGEGKPAEEQSSSADHPQITEHSSSAPADFFRDDQAAIPADTIIRYDTPAGTYAIDENFSVWYGGKKLKDYKTLPASKNFVKNNLEKGFEKKMKEMEKQLEAMKKAKDIESYRAKL